MKNRAEVVQAIFEQFKIISEMDVVDDAMLRVRANKIADRLGEDEPRMMVCSLDDGTCSHSKPHLENSDCQTHHKCIPMESATPIKSESSYPCHNCNGTGRTRRPYSVSCTVCGRSDCDASKHPNRLAMAEDCLRDIAERVEHAGTTEKMIKQISAICNGYWKCKCIPVESAKLLVTSCSTCENNGKGWLGCMDCKGEKWSPRKCDCNKEGEIEKLKAGSSVEEREDKINELVREVKELVRKVNKMEEGK